MSEYGDTTNYIAGILNRHTLAYKTSTLNNNNNNNYLVILWDILTQLPNINK